MAELSIINPVSASPSNVGNHALGYFNPCFNSCGKMTFVVLRCLSRNAWEYIMALTLMGVRHLISPRWLEKM